jgi:hypothetical protein
MFLFLLDRVTANHNQTLIHPLNPATASPGQPRG